ncbi:TetR family transcriptional regulator [Sphingomonas sp. HMP9]|uniref:TetR/AcrR family transcriptional regulator n=1 Tax=Sphingomonas sp. HMP9 TaxID=1517554 RepID=UPI0015975917|nr:TetR/AcrR family transcriptional regulator [Sphingomonas sp. HMP9]BCA61389.1 TetR family transcriptional regulator [Sphingomonas sp. HMP9]
MHLFWEHGYEGASLLTLRHAMGGISSASFYAAFGSKEALYRETLMRYLGRHGSIIDALDDERLPPRARLEQALMGSVAMQTDLAHPKGCMVTLSATISSEACASTRLLTRTERDATRQALKRCITAGVSAGNLAPTIDVAGLVALYDGLVLGISIQARDGVPADSIRAGIKHAMAAWGDDRQDTAS